MCHDCPTPRSRAKAVLNEVVADLLLPLILWAVPIGLLLATGYVEP